MNADNYRERYKRLTDSEFREVVGFYHSKFPNWKVIESSILVREAGPVVQGIAIERLSGGDYRPTGHVRIMVAPEEFWGFELPQNLRKCRSLNRRQDREFREHVVEAIRAEFIPCVDRPLDAEEVLKLCELEAVPTTGQAYSLAPLNAYLGNDQRALHWCARHAKLLHDKTQQGFPWHDLEYKQQAFLKELETWIKAGNAKEQLERVLQAERRKWGLGDA